jgi:Zn-dependent M16 (insulinase) family peptidase
MHAIEGSYGVHYSKGPEGFNHEDLPALTLACSTLNASESYLWKSIRGSGLAYGANVELDLESGLMGFQVYRVSHQRRWRVV